jgi:hypothetical protein
MKKKEAEKEVKGVRRISGDPFEIVMPQLEEDKRREYMRYESEDLN